MERILVGMETGRTSIWAVVHALNLAKRIKARVFILLVIDDALAKKGKDSFMDEMETSVKASLESLIEKGISDGLSIDYYITRGQYDNELVKFIRGNKITLLVVGSPTDKNYHHNDFSDFVEKIRHRIDCRIEVVHEKTAKTRERRK